MVTTFTIIAIICIALYGYTQLPKFGKAPSGDRLSAIKNSPNFKDGQFQNLEFTPSLTEGYSMFGVLLDMLFKAHPNRVPQNNIPSVKTDLLTLPKTENVLVWLGHSSYFMQINGQKFLVDPVLSTNASPVPGTTKSFKGTNVYQAEDFPAIDFLVITHDHYDHLDYPTILALKNKVDKVICPLGVGEHFEYWGYGADKLIEKDWNQHVQLTDEISINTVPARHFSGRKLKRNNTLWTAYVLQTPTQKIFIGGDSGYGTHFKTIGNKFGPIDLAILENGQYNEAWQAIHTLPHETLQAARDLQAKRILPVHNSKFALAMHKWYTPLTDLDSLNNNDFKIATPLIGQPVFLDNSDQVFKKWWQNLK